VFGPSGEDRPDVLTDAETVVLPLWLHRRASSAGGKSTANTASFLKNVPSPAQEDAQKEEATRPAAGAGAAPESGEPPEKTGNEVAPEAGPEAGPEAASGAGDVGAEAGDPGPGDPADAAQGEAKPGDAKPDEAKPGDAKPGEAGPGDAGPAAAAEATVAETDAATTTDADAEVQADALVQADGTTATDAQADAETLVGALPGTATKADPEAETVVGADAATAIKAGAEAEADSESDVGAKAKTDVEAKADVEADTKAKAKTNAGTDADADTVVVQVGRAAATTGLAPAEGTEPEPPAAEPPGGGTMGARSAGPDFPTLSRGIRPDAEVTTTLSRADLQSAMIQARTLEAIEAIEAIDALETSTLGGLEARTTKALETVEAISALEAKTAQAIKTIEAMTADALEAIDATVTGMTPGLTSRLVPPDQADEADADEAETPGPDRAKDAESSPGTEVARTRVIRIEEPPASVTLTTSSTETTIAVPQPRAESLVAVAPAPAMDDTTTLTPIPHRDSSGKPPALPSAEPQPEPSDKPRYTLAQRRTRVSRGLLLCILVLQAVLSLRLHNTAFEDEALYIYSGHMELEHLLHHAALQGSYASYFSGSPVLYPVAAGFLNALGGLTAARMFSLAEMLSITVLLYSMSRRLFNERVAVCAALLFSVCESAIFLGNFATYDATCLFLLSLAAWIMVRTAGFRWPVFLLAAPVAALAVGVKYAGLLFVPTIAVLPMLAGWPLRGRRVLVYPPVFVAAVAGLLYGALRLGGKAYMTAISSTTTQRAQGVTPVATLLREAAEWGGVIFVLAVIGTVAYVRRVRTEPEELIAPAGGRFRRLCLGLLLTGTALLAPAYQAHLHTDISFQKHIGFGLFFAAPMAGLGLARLLGDHYRRPHIAVGVWSLALVLGLVQTTNMYQVWPNSSQFVRTFSAYLQPHARYLVEVPEVPIYYLLGHKDAQPKQFTSTFYINYRNSKGVLLTGTVGFTAAVDAGYFHVVAYNNEITGAADAVLDEALSASNDYYLAAEIHITDVFGPGNYFIWVKGHPKKTIPVFVHASSKYLDLGSKVQQLGPARRAAAR
jgi:hypothetical protein